MQVTEALLNEIVEDLLFNKFDGEFGMVGVNGGAYEFQGVVVDWKRAKRGLLKLHIAGKSYELPLTQ